jgi:hypothetical protein
MANWKQQQLGKLHSNGKKSVQDISESKRGELSSNKTATVIS